MNEVMERPAMAVEITPEQIVAKRFWSKVAFSQAGCWEWTACKNQKGYGRFKLNGTLVSAHRFAYESCVGPIPEGLVIDHLKCDNPGCVNPSHLRIATNKENTTRGDNPAAMRSRQTHCMYGHEFTEANIYWTKAGNRHCKTCTKAHAKKRYQRKINGGIG